MLCAFKALFTTWEMEGYYNLVKACGGHGYSNYSGLPTLVKEEFPHQILEGDNSLLLLQLTRFLVKCFARLQKGKTEMLVGNFSFLIDLDVYADKEYSLTSSSAAPEVILDMFKKTTCMLTKDLAMKMFTLVQSKVDPKLAWDTLLGVENLRLGTVFAVQLILECALQAVSKISSPKIKEAMMRLVGLQAINLAIDHSFSLMYSGALKNEHISLFIDRKHQLLEEISPDALVLAEGMQWPDELLGSAIGHSRLEPYETLLHWAKSIGVLNQYANQVHPSIPLYQQKVAKHREQML
jgi:hypothetical protein